MPASRPSLWPSGGLRHRIFPPTLPRPALADRLSRKALVLATELGGGVVPMDPAQRAAREAAGRLACLLAARAETVVQVWCGLPLVLKGTLPLRLPEAEQR